MTMRIAGSVLCGLLLLAATTNAFADVNTAVSGVSIIRLTTVPNTTAKTGTFPKAARKTGTGRTTGLPQAISDQAAAGNLSSFLPTASHESQKGGRLPRGQRR